MQYFITTFGPYLILGLLLLWALYRGLRDNEERNKQRRAQRWLEAAAGAANDVEAQAADAVDPDTTVTASTRSHISKTNNEQYYHFRRPVTKTVRDFNKTTGKVEERTVTQQVGYATVFFRQEVPRNAAQPDESWFASVALCDHRDQFCKQTGRNIARRKYMSGHQIPIDQKPTFEIAKRLAEQALTNRRS
jgi:hypothetical protein